MLVPMIPLRSIPALAAGYSSAILADSPVAYWRLGETSGTVAADATGHGNAGTYAGAAGSYTLGQPGALFQDGDTATQFDGRAGYVVVPNSTGLQTNQVSIELWIKKLTETPWGTYISKNVAYGGKSGSGWFQLLNYGSTGRLQFRVTGEDAASSLQSASTLLLNTWYHVVATYDGTTARLYVNGASDSSLSVTATPAQTGDPLYIGRRPDGYYSNAVLDEVAIYSSALSAAQVMNHWVASGNPPASPTSVTAISPANNQAKVTWVDPVTGGATSITGYTITPHLGLTIRTPVTVSGATATTTTLIGVGAGTYTFTVVANNANGTSSPSAATANLVVAGSTYGYSATVLADSPAAYWRLGEATGTAAADATGHGTTATYFGTRTQASGGAIFGDPDTSVSFDGSTGYVIAPSVSSLNTNQVSIELWLKKVTETANGAYVSKNFNPGGGAGTGWFELMNNNTTGQLQFRVTGDTADVSLNSITKLALATWYDVVATYDGTTAKIYINGALDNSLSLSATPTQTSDPLYIGRRSDGYYNNAFLDEVAIYGSALSAAQVSTHWQAGGLVPGAPTAVAATLPRKTTNQASVSWTAPAFAGSSAITGYTVSIQGGPTQLLPVSATASPVTITGLSGGSSYSFSVVAQNGSGAGPASTVSNAVTPTGSAVPTVPTSLSASAGNTQATVSWSAPTSNGGSAITGYTVTPFVGATAGTAKTVTATTLSTIITGLVNGTTYTFQVYAGNAVGPGRAASTTATTPAAAPAAPANVTATAGDAQARVSWTAPANGGSAITGYTVTPYVGTVAQTATSVSGSTTAVTITGLANGTTYSFQVTATNAVGTSAAGVSGQVAPVGTGPSVPGPPTSVSASVANGGAVVTWLAPSTSGSAITSYTLTPYVGTTAGTPVTLVGSPPATTQTISGLTNGITYVIYVSAANSVGSGPAGTSNLVTPAAVPGIPAAVTAVAGNAQATVTWTSPASNGGTIQTYTVTAYAGNTMFSASTVTGGVTSLAMAGLTNGTSYYFTVVATNAAGSSSVGTSNTVTPATIPAAPSSVSAVSGSASATVSWTAPSGNGSAIASYTVTPFAGSVAGTPATATTTSVTISGLTNGTAYTFQVTATNAIGTGGVGISNLVTVGTTLPPTSVSATSPSANQATISWTAPAGGASAVTGYVVTAYSGLQAKNSIGTGVTTTVSLTGLSAGIYTFQVAALNASGTSSSSSPSGSLTVSGATSTYASTIQADGPSIYYRLDESSGTVAGDSSGNGRSAGYGGGYTQGAGGALLNDPDPGVSFANGWVSQLVPGPGLPTGNAARSLEAWVKTTSTGPIVRYGNLNNENQFNLKVVAGNQLQLYAYNDSVTFTTPHGVGDGAWHQVVATYDPSNVLTMYFDGISLGSQSFLATLNAIVNNNGLVMGNDQNGTLTGSVDEVALYPYVLTAAQVAAHFNASGNSRPTAPSGVTASSTLANQATVSWTASTASAGAPVSAYLVTAFAGSKAQSSLGVSGSTTSATITGLKGGTAYSFQVMAMNSFGNSPNGVSGTVTPTGATSTYASTIQADGPSIYYRFSETTGTLLADSSGNARPGGVYGSYALGASGALPNDPDVAISLSGGAVNQSVAGAGLPLGNAARSMEAWFKTVGTGPIMWYGNGSTRGLFDLRLSAASQLQLVAYSDDHNFTTPYSVADGVWHQVVATYDTTTLMLYLDGQTLGTATFGGPLNTVPDSNGFLLGNDYWARLTATLDEVAVYPKALTASQVAAHYTASGNATLPSAPGAVRAAGGNAQTSVSWNPSSGNGGTVASYTVTPFAGTAAGTPQQVTAPATSTTVTGLTNGTTYTFQVTATSNVGTSQPGISNAVTIGAPGAPTGVSAAGGNAQATVTWGVPAANASAISSYTITPYLGTTAGTATTVSGAPPPTSAVIGTLVNGATYTFAVSATNGYGSGPAGTSNTVMPGVPGAPAGVTASIPAVTNTATVSWTASASNGLAITGYVVTAITNLGVPQNTIALGAAATSATISGLVGGASYSFQVVATTASGNSAASVSAAVTPTGSTTTYASTVLGDGPSIYYRLGDPSGSLAADSSGNGSLGTYSGTYTLGAAGAALNDSDTAVSVNGGQVQNATAAVPLGNSSRTLEAWVKTTGGGSAVQGLVGYGSQSTRGMFDLRLYNSNQIGVAGWADDHYFTAPYSITSGSWHQVVATYDGSIVTVYLDGQSLGTASFSAPLATSLDGNGLILGRDSWWNGEWLNGALDEVAVYPQALSAAQVAAHFNASANARLTAPGAVTATTGTNQATVTWSAPSGTVSRYLVTAYQGASAQNSESLNAPATSAVLTGLKSGVPYTVQVVAYNGLGASPAGVSAAVTPTGNNPMYAPTVLADGPVEYYRLGDPSGTVAADSSGNNQQGTYSGTYGLGTSSAFPNDPDKSTGFNGGMMVAPDAPLPMGNGSRTIEAWLNTSNGGCCNAQAIAGYGSSGTRTLFQMHLTSTNVVSVVTGNDDHYFTVPRSLINGQWHQFVATYDGPSLTLKLYVDGAVAGQATLADALGTISNGSGLVIGRESSAQNWNWINGSIDDVSVYGTALSAAQVTTHFQASGNAQPAAPTAVAAVAGANQATVSWTAPAGTVTGYLLTTSTGSRAQNAMAVGNVTSATISGLNLGSAYTFQVVASNNFGNSPPSTASAPVTISTGSAGGYAQTVIGDGPIEYYRLDDSGSGVAADSAGTGQLGTYTGSYGLGAASALPNDADKSASFNGGMMSAPDAPLPMGNSSRTIEAWINTSTVGCCAGQAIAGYGSSATRDLFQLRMTGTNTIGIATGNDDHFFAVSRPLTNGQWHQVVATYDGPSLTLNVYVDGTVVGQAAVGDALGTVSNGSGLVVGRESSATNWNWFNGSIDDVSVYSAALSAARVTAHFQASGNAQPASPTAVTAAAGANQATVSWTAPAGTVTGYLVTATTGGKAQNAVAVGAVTSTTLTGLTIGSAYTFQVVATNNFGNSPPSAASAPITISTGSSGGYASTVLADGPVEYYRLDDSGSNAVASDSSGSGQTGTYSGTYTSGSGSALLNDSDKSASFNGGLMTAPDAPLPMDNNARSIEAWFNTSTVGCCAGQAIAGYGSTGTRTLFQVRLVGTNQIAVVTGNDDHTFTAGYALTNGVWHQIVATYDGTTLVVYADGQSIGQTTLADALGTISNGSGLVVGRESSAQNWNWFNGPLDDVATYAKALSLTQVSAHWAAAGYRRPSAPINVQASAGPQGAVVAWTAPTDLGNPLLTGYTITPFAASVAGTPVSVGPNLTNVTITGLSAQTAYTFQVKPNAIYDPPVSSSGAITTALAQTPVPSNSAYVLETAYPDNSHYGQTFLPSPWQGAPNTTFIGDAGPYDSGAIRIHDLSGSGLTLNDLQVDIGPYHFANTWGTNLAVPAGGDLILTEMSNLGFDTSDTPPNSSCTGSGYIPVIHATVNGLHIDWKDFAQVLNTGGIDWGDCIFPPAEGRDWSIVHNGPLPSQVMGPNGSMKICWTCMGLPVNTASGDFWHSFTDFDIPGRGFNLHMNRTYNSQAAPYDSRFGYGWSDSYNMFLSFDAASGMVLVHQEAGASANFTVSGTAYTPTSGILATLVRNGDGSFTFQRTDLAKYTFNPRGELLSETDRNGYVTSFSYISDQLTTVTEPAGRTLNFTYNGSHVSQTHDTAGNRTVSYNYDGNGNLTSATDVGGAVTKFTYDASHLMLTMTEPNGGTVTNVFDSSGRDTNQTDAMGRVTQFAYTQGKTTITDPNGNQTVDVYENGQLMQETKAAGTLLAATWSYSYDPISWGVTTVKDPNGNVTTNTWDANGKLLTKTDALLQKTSYTYNSFNQVLTATDPLGVTTSNTYDASGNLTRAFTPLTGTTQYAVTGFTYDPTHAGDLTQMTDANGKLWQYGYDAYGLRNKAIDPLGDTTSYSFDTVGRLQSIVSPKGNVQGGNPSAYTTTFTFNAYGDRLSALDQLSHLTSYKYDANRNRIALIDGSNHQTSYAFDADNELVQLVRPDGSKLKTVYDNDGNVTQQIDGLGNPTAYQYNALNQSTQIVDPLNRATRYAYDGVANLLTVQNPKDSGVSYTMTYDQANQLKAVTYSDGLTPKVSYEYDADGQRQQMVDGTGTTSYSFDSLHRLAQFKNGAGAQVQYGYDLLGHLTKLVYPGGINAVNRAYDDAGRLVSVTDWLANTTRFGFDPNGNLGTQSYPNGALATLTYDASDRLMQIVDTANGSQLLNLTNTRDASNRLTGENSTIYGYDSNDRVTATTTAASPTTYAYDAADNLTKTSGANTTSQVYDAANQLQTATTMNGQTLVQRYTYANDPNGNRISRTDKNGVVTNYVWDQANRLTGAATTATYVYNGDGLRMNKTVSGTPEAFTWNVVGGLPTIIQDGSTSYVTDDSGLPIEQIAGAAVYYYHHDQLGSTRALTTSAGSMAAMYTYDAYGNVSVTGNVTNPFQFAGQYADGESGLTYMRSRFYDPADGQFLSVDSLRARTREPYAYAVDSPLNRVDRSGAGPELLCALLLLPGAGEVACGLGIAASLVLVGISVVMMSRAANPRDPIVPPSLLNHSDDMGNPAQGGGGGGFFKRAAAGLTVIMAVIGGWAIGQGENGPPPVPEPGPRPSPCPSPSLSGSASPDPSSGPPAPTPSPMPGPDPGLANR